MCIAFTMLDKFMSSYYSGVNVYKLPNHSWQGMGVICISRVALPNNMHCVPSWIYICLQSNSYLFVTEISVCNFVVNGTILLHNTCVCNCIGGSC